MVGAALLQHLQKLCVLVTVELQVNLGKGSFRDVSLHRVGLLIPDIAASKS